MEFSYLVNFDFKTNSASRESRIDEDGYQWLYLDRKIGQFPPSRGVFSTNFLTNEEIVLEWHFDERLLDRQMTTSRKLER